MPCTGVHFMETTDPIGPLGARSVSESPFNPVAPAFANALRDERSVAATGDEAGGRRHAGGVRNQSASGVQNIWRAPR